MSLSPFRRVTRPGREANDDPEALAALREILVAPEQHEIDEIKRKLDEAQVTSRAVSDVLADAVRLSTTEGDDDLARALAPTIEESIEVSVRRNPKPLIAAISPVIGPSIRKSIAETFRGLLQSLNHSLEQSLSIQGLRWRIEAWRTGRPFAEVVLLHSLRYRVEQVFLIHKETGLLLEHVALDEEESENSDLVSGMLTAIQDFVRDSFGGESGDALESLRVGDRTVWIEEGSYAILAAVIRGNAPETLRGTLRATLDSVHRLLPEDLASFDGDPAPFEMVRPQLHDCLKTEYKEPEKSRRGIVLVVWLLIALLLLLGLWWLWSSARAERRAETRWSAYLEHLRLEPGLVVVHAERRDEEHRLRGLRDPLAKDPASLLAEHELRPEQVEATWAPYHAGDPALVERRARKALSPPDTVVLVFEGAALRASGSARTRWIRDSRLLVRALPGIEGYDDSEVVDTDEVERNKALAEKRRREREQLEAEVQALNRRVARRRLRFHVGTTKFRANQGEELDALADEARRLLYMASTLGADSILRVTGHTDPTGTREFNDRLSVERAKAVVGALVERGLPAERLTVRGLGSKLADESTEGRAAWQDSRAVTFDVLGVGEAPR